MIEAEHPIIVNANINGIWNYVQDIRKWANLFPGCRECSVIDEHDSRWTIKVGAGGLVKTVNVLVHVEQWDGPGRVNFLYKLESEPVIGSGSYIATAIGTNETEITLKLRVEGSGPMAPMWEAVGKPLLPQLAKLFSAKLKSEIEASIDTPAAQAETAPAPASASLLTTLKNWLRHLWRTMTGSATN